MRNRIFIALVLVTTAISGRGQDTVTRSKYLSLTTGVHQVVEENIMPLRHQGVVWKPGFGKERVAKNKQAYNIQLAFARPKFRLEESRTSVYGALNARYRYEFGVANATKLRVHAGPYAGIDYNVDMYSNWDDSHLYRGNHANIGVSTSAKYTVNETSRINLTAETPVFGVLSRTDLYRLYKIDDIAFGAIVKSQHSNIVAGSWDVVRYVNVALEYQSQLTPRRQYAMGYNFGVARLKHPDSEPMRMLQHTVHV